VTNPVYIGVDPPAQSNVDRYAGFSREYGEVPTYQCVLSEEAGYDIGKKVLKEGLYDGAFCYCDDIASGFVQAVREGGYPVSVIGFDGVRATKYLNLSTISQEPTSIGTRAASLIVDIMRSREELEPIIECRKPILIDRGS
ncbi:MAG: substrate-binding domain-containing protein, partial [Sphaerochaetaceae bacterium]